jgi:hypothetical protein
MAVAQDESIRSSQIYVQKLGIVYDSARIQPEIKNTGAGLSINHRLNKIRKTVFGMDGFARSHPVSFCDRMIGP